MDRKKKEGRNGRPGSARKKTDRGQNKCPAPGISLYPKDVMHHGKPGINVGLEAVFIVCTGCRDCVCVRAQCV